MELRRGQTGARSLNKAIRAFAVGTPVNAVAAQGTLTIAEPVTAEDTMTIDTTVYTFKADGTAAAAGDIDLGADEATTKLNIVKAIKGTDSINEAHPTVDCAAAFTGDDLVLTAREKGADGDTIDTTETFTHISNVFDAATLGTTTAGVTATVGEAGQIGIGENEATTKLNIVSAINGGDEFGNNPAHPTVSAAAFSGDDCVLTAKTKGVAGNSIETTETLTHADNVFDADTLGTTTAGVDGTVGEAGEVMHDGTNLYIAIDENGIDGDNWHYVATSVVS